MRSQWFIWALVAAFGIFVLVIFNYQGKQDALSLSSIFPDQDKEAMTDNIEYEFVDTPKEFVRAQVPVIVKEDASISSKPVERRPQIVQAVTPTRPTESVALKPVPSSREARTGQTTQSVPNVPITPAKSPGVNVLSVPPSNARFTIQIASFKDRESAEISLKGIKAAGHSGYIVTKDLGAKGTWYRIYVGQYQSKEEANQKLSELKSNYSSSFIISP